MKIKTFLKSIACSALLALSFNANAERIELGSYNHWDSYKLTFPNGVADDPNITWLCATRGFFTSNRGENYKIIFAFYNTGLAKFFVEDTKYVYTPGFRRNVEVHVFNQFRQEIFGAFAHYQNLSQTTVKQIGFNTNVDFIKSVFAGYVLQVGLPDGTVMNFDISDREFNQALGVTINRCVLNQNTTPMQDM